MKATHLLAAGLLTAAAVSSAYADVETNAMATASWGYKITGLGESGRDVALVFTNSADKTMSWTKPEILSGFDFLVVGGGGGGGGGMNNAPSGGGGAGGLAKGSVHDLTGVAVLNITVGAGGVGGAGAISGGTRKDGAQGGMSKIAVGETDYVTAYGGGGGAAYAHDGGVGACGGGAGGAYSGSVCGGVGQTNDVGALKADFVTGTLHGNVGGSGYAGGVYGAGGGGAGGVGGNAEVKKTGTGGKGLGVDITGEDAVYAAGGNGVAGSWSVAPPSDAKANTGNGGNGATSAKPGARGGSGIVILRYTLPEGVVEKPLIASKVYTGGPQIADVSESDAYTITANNGGTEAGDYSVNLRLNQGYSWLEGGSEDALLTFTITPAQNEWTVDPAISKERWSTSDNPGVLTRGETLFGTPVSMISKDDGDWGDFDGTVPTEAGVYEIRYDVPTSVSWNDPEETSKSVSFKIYVAGAIPAFTVDAYRLTSEVVEGKTDLDIVFTVTPEVASEQLVAVHALCRPAGTTEPAEDIVLAEDFSLTQTEGNGRIANLKPGETYEIALYGCGGAEGAMTFSPTSEVRAVTMSGPATGLEAEATFTNDPREFAINGSVTPGMGTTTVTVRWSLNSDALDQSQVFSFAADDEGMFSVSVPYAEASDALTWKVEVTNAFASATYGSLGWSTATPQTKKTRADVQAVTYTWTGNGGDNRWTNIDNWSADTSECYGYPNNVNYASAKVAQSVTIDLCGETVLLVNGAGVILAANKVVTLTNGTLKVNHVADGDFGANGATLVIRDATLDRQRLNPTDGMRVIFEGRSTLTGMVRPWNSKNAKIIFRNGDITIGNNLGNGSSKEGTEVIVSNATVTVNGPVTSNWGPGTYPLQMQNGPDRQARLVHANDNGFDFVQSPYTLAIPERAYATPYLQAVKPSKVITTSPAFKIDVTNWKHAARVPILTFTESADGAEAQYGKATLKAYANGIDVTEQRHAKLVWDEGSKTLYYTQDSLMGMMIYVR